MHFRVPYKSFSSFQFDFRPRQLSPTRRGVVPLWDYLVGVLNWSIMNRVRLLGLGKEAANAVQVAAYVYNKSKVMVVDVTISEVTFVGLTISVVMLKFWK